MRGSKLIGGFIFMAEIVNDKGSVVETSTVSSQATKLQAQFG